MDSGSGTTGGMVGRPPCWRTLEESRQGLGSVSLKINNQHTHTHVRTHEHRTCPNAFTRISRAWGAFFHQFIFSSVFTLSDLKFKPNTKTR
jgi:hypothetical protein